jgi:hypothetical protein
MPKRSKPPAQSAAEAAIKEILQYAGARSAYEELCKRGMNRELLATRLLALRNLRRTRRSELLVNPKTSRVLSKKLAALLREIDSLHVISWRRRRLVPSEPEPPIVIEWNGLLPPIGRSTIQFDVNLLREQLRAGSRYFARVGRARQPILYGYDVKDLDLRRLLNDVQKYTGAAHDREVALLCTAATGGRYEVTEHLLIMRRSRSRQVY